MGLAVSHSFRVLGVWVWWEIWHMMCCIYQAQVPLLTYPSQFRGVHVLVRVTPHCF